MKNIKSAFLIILAFLMQAINAQQNLRVDSIFAAEINSQNIGVAVMVVKDGVVKYSNAYGYSNVPAKTLAAASSNFNFSGINDQLTATAILMLNKTGKLELGEPINKIIPELPEYTSQISVSHLLQQTSGISSFDMDVFLEKKSVVSQKDILSFFSTTNKTKFPSGQNLDINPINYILLALIIERRSGISYSAFITKNIFKPLAMKNSKVVFGNLASVKNRAHGYISKTQTEDASILKYNVSGFADLYSSLNDYARFIASLDAGTLIAPAAIENMFKINFMPGILKFYGYGWYLSFNKGKRYAFQSGNEFGFTNIVIRIPEDKITVVILTNNAGISGLRKKAFSVLNLFSDFKYQIE